MADVRSSHIFAKKVVLRKETGMSMRLAADFMRGRRYSGTTDKV